jgi:hypothetical protein
MSRNGYEMDDDARDPSTHADASRETSSEPPPQPRPRKSRAPKASTKAATAKSETKGRPRKSVAPRSRRAATDIKTPQGVVVDLSERHHPDLISIPPADLDEHDERFFAEGETAAQHAARAARTKTARAHASDLAEQSLAPVVPHAHRQKLANYVKVAMGFSVVVCLAAFTRVGLSKLEAGRGSERSAAASVVAEAPAAPVMNAAPVPADAPAATPTENETPLMSATEEREAARDALEHGKASDAIESATRSLKVDPTDAEAWLLLGAANQEAGHHAEAHAAFLECTKQAKTGNVGECGALLSWNGPR